MGFATISEAEARYAHQDHYTGAFEVARVQRSGPWDFPPFSLFFGLGDFGGWHGIASTDGTKIVVTRSAHLDLATAVQVYEIGAADVDRIEVGIFKTSILLKQRVAGLTKGTAVRSLLIIPGVLLGIVPAIIALFMPEQLLQQRILDDFGKKGAFTSALKGCAR